MNHSCKNNIHDLDVARCDIDRIDREIHQLILRRCDIVQSILQFKQKSGTNDLSLRCHREADIFRTLLANHEGSLSAHALIQIWREILFGSVEMQGGVNVLVPRFQDQMLLDQMLRVYFGARMKYEIMDSYDQTFDYLKQPSCAVGVFYHSPYCEEKIAPWWYDFEKYAHVRIIGYVPGLPDYHSPCPEVFLAGNIDIHSSQKDRCLMAVYARDGITWEDIESVLDQKGLKGHIMSQYQQGFLVNLEGFFAIDDGVLGGLKDDKNSGIDRTHVLGVYPCFSLVA